MRSKELKDLIRREIVAALREQKTPEEIAADKADVTAAQARLKDAQEKLKKAQAKAATKEGALKLKDLLEQEEEEEAGANPFAAGGDEGGEEEAGGDDAAAEEGGEEDAAAEEGGEEEKAEPDPEMPKKDDITVDFDISSVKRYNKDQRFRGSQGIVKKVTKDGMMLTVIPDGVDIFVNFNDIE